MRAAIVAKGFPSANNLRAQFLTRLISKYDRPIADYIPSFAEFVTALGGEILTVDTEQMVAFVDNERFTDNADFDELFVAIRAALGMYDPAPPHGITHIPASLLAYSIVALVIRKKMVSLVRVVYFY